jgi:hypothetical protein
MVTRRFIKAFPEQLYQLCATGRAPLTNNGAGYVWQDALEELRVEFEWVLNCHPGSRIVARGSEWWQIDRGQVAVRFWIAAMEIEGTA